MKINNQEHKKRLVAAFDGIDIKWLAKQLKTSKGVIYNIKYGFRKVSALRAKDLHRITNGQLDKKVLRPDIYAD